MKKWLLLIMTCCVNIFAQQAEEAAFAVQDGRVITPSFYSGVINLSDLNQSAASSGAMYEIKASGRYYIANNLMMKAGGNDTVTAIRISADNVLLDMNSASIYYAHNNLATGAIGIEVASDKSNITIRNGSVQGINDNGIKVGSSADNITLENVNVTGCTSATTEAVGLYLDSCNRVTVKNCAFNNNTNTDSDASSDSGNVSGVKMIDCTGCTFENCSANDNNSTDEKVYGFKLDVSSGGNKYNRFIDCVAIGNTTGSNNVSDDSAIGFYLKTGQGNILENCQSIGNNTTGNGTSLIAAGFMLDGTEKYSSIINCLAQNNFITTGTTTNSYGILVQAGVSYCEIRDNFLMANDASVANSAYGIFDANNSGGSESTLIYVRNFAYANGAGAIGVDNYSIVQKGTPTTFQVLTANYDDYTNITAARDDYKNVEIVA